MKALCMAALAFLAFSHAALCASALAAKPAQWSFSSDASGLQVSVKLQPGVYLYADKLKLSAKLPGGASIAPESGPEAVVHKDAFGGAPVQVYLSHDGSALKWSFPASKLEWPLTVSLEFQGCRDASEGRPALCFIPEELAAAIKGPGESGFLSRSIPEEPSSSVAAAAKPSALDSFKLLRSASGYMGAGDFLAFLKGSAAPNPFAGRGFFAIALLALLGGLALNLTPCVLPMIPVNLAIIGAGAGEGGKLKAAMRGLVYGSGIALTYGLLGLVAALGWAGFGQINSAWWFNLGAGLLFAGLALAMFEIFELDLSKYGSGLELPSGARLAGVFVLGAVSAILAGACVAPVLIAVLLHSANLYAEGDKSGLLLPFILGIGMALPWPLAAAGLAFVPKPGSWMLRVKQALGVLIALLAVYYIWTGASMLHLKLSMGKGSDASPESQLVALDNALNASLADGRPVLVDFWASWCKNCEAMEASTFQSDSVKDALKGFHVVKFRAEDPAGKALKPLLDRLNVVGLPTYVLLERAEP